MKRRHFFASTIALIATAGRSLAQPRDQRRVLGYLSGSIRPPPEILTRNPTLRTLAELGYVEGRNLVVEWRYADGDLERLPALAADLVHRRVDAIVAVGGLVSIAAARATSELPVVILSAGDPVGIGLVANLARPGGNVTGLSEASTDLSSKRFDLLRQVVPGAQRIAVIWNAADPGMTLRYRAIEHAAEPMGARIDAYGLRASSEIDAALATIADSRADAMMVVADPLTIVNQRRFTEFAAVRRLPAMYEFAEHVRAGGLMAYGPSLPDQMARAGQYVARILDGARPADLPMEQPTRFYLTVNLRTARAMGIELPAMVVALADEVVE